MWWYNILGDNEGSISNLLRCDTISVWSILIIVKIVELKRENYEPILAVKRAKWSKFIDYSGLSIEAKLSRVVKKKIHFSHVGYIPRPSSIKLRISRHHLEKYFNL